MDQHLFSFGLDLVIAVLLGITIVYAYLLNRRLQALRADREEMEKLIRRFYDATQTADASIKGLKNSAQELAKDLQTNIDKAKILRDEMAFMLERGDLLAGQLENSISASRPERQQQDLSQLLDAARQTGGREKRPKDTNRLESLLQESKEDASAVEKELMKALKGLR
jgi:uncharacterized membrane protein YccC